MLDILQGTPLWVYGVFLLICYYGIKARKAHLERPRTLLITPLLFALWSFFSLKYADHFAITLCVWLVGIVLGCLAASSLFPHQRLTLAEGGQRLIVPGSWNILGIYLLFFAIKYFLGYQEAVHPEHSNDAELILIAGFAPGFTVGLFFGRAANYYRGWLELRGVGV
ncbi:hypothetical protein GNF76_26720 [Pseudomonas sp. CCM 7893]|uniref:DUF1453 domain-containing protein n=1 Tax=Pseudomonas spelaei TaxID=1055469 RepID=A0A6I3WKR1_9PSED|nr:DUF6622 family protein [Pseudomonas spelaei]MUF07943.1 hypothetical protein [Pseudomonas spelaei]